MGEPPKDLLAEAKETELDGPTNLGHVSGPGLNPGQAWGLQPRLPREGQTCERRPCSERAFFKGVSRHPNTQERRSNTIQFTHGLW